MQGTEQTLRAKKITKDAKIDVKIDAVFAR
jgi:hypothetical protein